MTTGIAGDSNHPPRLFEAGRQDPAGSLPESETPRSDPHSGDAGGGTDMQGVSGASSGDGTEPPQNVPSRHCVYRFYDVGGVLLYVGLTCRFGERVSKHKSEKDWWLDVANVEIDHVGSREEARALELRHIRRLEPLYNIEGNARADKSNDPCCEDCGSTELYQIVWGAFYRGLESIQGSRPVFLEEDFGFFVPNRGDPVARLLCDNCEDYQYAVEWHGKHRELDAVERVVFDELGGWATEPRICS